jgi:hypothetical protein
MKSVAFFISSHGFGHAARACAVIESLHQLIPSLKIHIFTQVPAWFFTESLQGDFSYHDTWTDIGLVQKTPLEEDPAATLEELARCLPFASDRVDSLTRKMKGLECRIVICDIAPLGIAVARSAGLPSVLIENFTWDWIYAAFAEEWQDFGEHITYLRELFALVDYHIQTRPVCKPSPAAVLTVDPVSRKPRSTRAAIRRQLGIPADTPLVLLSMGGIRHSYRDLGYLRDIQGCHFIVPGGLENERLEGNLILLPHHCRWYHPDLVQASDIVIGKAGYSTVAEAFNSGTSFGFIQRPRFRESEVMSAFVLEKMNGVEIPAGAFENGNWTSAIPALLSSAARPAPRHDNGSLTIAGRLLRLLSALL